MLSESEASLPGERCFALAQHDSLEAVSADSQDVFFELYWPKWPDEKRPGDLAITGPIFTRNVQFPPALIILVPPVPALSEAVASLRNPPQ